jgi:mycothiol maleylpyruvate isomerase-like protein
VAGRPVPDVPEISPLEAFSRAADALYGMLCALRDEDWRRTVLRDLDVQRLIGHLTGVEEDMQRCLSGDPAGPTPTMSAPPSPGPPARAGSRRPARAPGGAARPTALSRWPASMGI